MSDVSQGLGWWQASDGNWYAPQPAVAPPPPPAHPPASEKMPKKPIYKRVWFWLLIGVVVLFGGCAALVTGASVAINSASKKQHTVLYSVTGDGTVNIIYGNFASGNSGSTQLTGQTLPWNRTITGRGLFNVYNVNATIVTGSTVTCSISVDGRTTTTRTSTGPSVNVTCNAMGE